MRGSCKSKSQTYTQWKWPENALQCKQITDDHSDFVAV